MPYIYRERQCLFYLLWPINRLALNSNYEAQACLCVWSQIMENTSTSGCNGMSSAALYCEWVEACSVMFCLLNADCWPGTR